MPIVDRQGSFTILGVSEGAGVRPVCTLDPNTIVEQREDGSFCIKPIESQNVFTNEELFELLGMAQP